MGYYWLTQLLNAKPHKHPFPEHMTYVRKIAADGMVLLKNENNTLPLKPGKVALFGAGAVDTVFCGTGSGYAFAPYTINCYEGLKNAGFQITSEKWLKRFMKASKQANQKDKTLNFLDAVWGGMRILIDDLPITNEELTAAKESDTAIYVIRRNAGEGGDRKLEKGDYYLSDQEMNNLKTIAKHFAHTIVVLNTCVIDTNFLLDIPGIDAVLLMSISGNESGNSLADVLTGKSAPTGRLADTWARQYADYPASATFASNDGNSLQEDYNEDIFVGYRYFDSMGIEPMFPFGYGLGYGQFNLSAVSVDVNWKEVSIKVAVENIGSHSDREVVQLYVSAPSGKLVQPWQELRGFAKTKLLDPGEKEIVTITIPTETLASYDMDTAAFVMEAGKYILRIGDHSRHTIPVANILVDETAAIRKVESRLALDRELTLVQPKAEIKAPVDYGAKNYYRHTKLVPSDIPEIGLTAKDCICVQGYNPWYRRTDEQHAAIVKDETATLLDVKAGKVSLESFVASLPEEVLYRLVAGASSETPYPVPSRNPGKVTDFKAPTSSGSTTKQYLKTLGIPQWMLTDGPAGLHISSSGATCNPVGMALAQTWDLEVCRKIGLGIGKELEACNYSVILGPGMNIHRDPLCGRNFEYFSEDPLVSGKIAAAYTIGVQEIPGTAVSIKHFACNNQETDRFKQNSTVTERALREIYLRGFEICVREAEPKTIMSSYNCINGIHTSSNPELLIDILRDEWGFHGLVMTDWGTESRKNLDLNAGNNLIMGGYRSDYLKAAYEGIAPVFDKDGYVKVDVFNVYGGFVKERVEQWNAFVPSKDGADRISTTVASGVKLNDRVLEMEKAGIAQITRNSDGSYTVTYRGTSEGKTLSRKVLEQNACVVLEQILDSVSYRLSFQ